jgi:type IV fimbrial biogenesis protein FimT
LPGTSMSGWCRRRGNLSHAGRRTRRDPSRREDSCRVAAPALGVGLAELVVALGIIAILAAVSAPTILDFLRNARVHATAEEVAAFLNQGRQLAIASGESVCVHALAAAVRFHLGGCSGPAWTGPGTTASGDLTVPEGIALEVNADPVFSALGNATPGATYTVRDLRSDKTRRVRVAPSGRVSIAP